MLTGAVNWGYFLMQTKERRIDVEIIYIGCTYLYLINVARIVTPTPNSANEYATVFRSASIWGNSYSKIEVELFTSVVVAPNTLPLSITMLQNVEY